MRRRDLVGWALLGAAAVAAAAALVPALRPLVLFGLYSVPANSAIPIPHEPGVLSFALLAPALPLALAGALGAFAGAWVDRWMLAWVFRRPMGEALRSARSWRALERWLMRAPFLTTLLVAFTGFPPVQIIRLLVVASGYSTWRYALALALGRLPRFYLMALLGQALGPPAWLMIALMLAFLVGPAIALLRRGPRPRLLEGEAPTS